jgi:hypothetical protein
MPIQLRDTDVRTDALTTLLCERLPASRRAHVLSVLEPLYRSADTDGTYEFFPSRKIDVDAVQRALAAAAPDLTVDRLLFVSVTDGDVRLKIFADHGQRASHAVGEQLYRRILRGTLGDAIQNDLAGTLHLHAGRVLRHRVGDACWNMLQHLVSEILVAPHGVLTAIPILSCYLAQQMVCADHLPIRLEPLVRKFTKCIPYGVLREEPGTWVLRCSAR